MKKRIFILGLLITLFAGAGIAQDSTQQKRLSQLLPDYYGLKDALVSGDPTIASQKAEDFVKTLNGIDHEFIAEDNANALLKDAGAISETKDLKSQREYFSKLSDNMFILAKAVNLSSAAIYQQYCPMKKTYWLSPDKQIRNPYYGNAMLTCGKVTVTLE